MGFSPGDPISGEIAMFPDLQSRSALMFERAKLALPGGNSRHSLAVSPYPIYAASGSGCRVRDIDGSEYVDCINNMSANIHGHRHPAILAAVDRQMDRLISVGLPTEVEVELAETLCARVDSVERVRFANTGTEALMFAARAARAFTGRNKVAKIEGGYHGSYDALDVSNRPSPDAWGHAETPNVVRESGGFTDGSVADTIILPVNNLDATRSLIARHGDDLAAVVVDPLVSRMGFLKVDQAYLDMLREETERRGIVLVFDEVFSFRIGLQGAQGEVGIRPDLSTFGKVIGGGFPIGAVGGKADIMQMFSHLPKGRPIVEHSGTFNANPVSMAAGKAALDLFDAAAVSRLAGLGDRLREGLTRTLADLGLAWRVQGYGSLATILPFKDPARDYRAFHGAMAAANAGSTMAAFHRGMVNRGILPTFPAAFILSTAMDEAVIDSIVGAARESLSEIRNGSAQAA